ncbi:hypothetical protein NKG94_09320 [Micromonospora sp. M12]
MHGPAPPSAPHCDHQIASSRRRGHHPRRRHTHHPTPTRGDRRAAPHLPERHPTAAAPTHPAPAPPPTGSADRHQRVRQRTANPRTDPGPAAPQVTGPLCAALPTGTDPGNPTFLAGQPVDQALRWIPTLTTFEAALRTSGVLTDLPAGAGVTILAPPTTPSPRRSPRTTGTT